MVDTAPPTPKGLAARYLTLFGGEAVGKLCVMAAFVYLAHVLTQRELSIVELALSLTIFFVLGVESGMGSYCARLVAANPERLPALVASVIVLRAIYGLPIYLLVLAVAWHYRVAGLGILAINGLSVLLTPFYLQWVFQGLRQMQWVATGTALRSLTFVALIVLLIRAGSDIRLVAVAEISGAAILAGYNLFIVLRRLGVRPEWKGALAGAGELFRDAGYLGLADLAWAGLWYGPSIILGWLAIEQVAWIATPVRIVVALHTFVWLYFFNLLPNLAREWKAGPVAWRQLVERSMRLSMWPACFLAVSGTLVAPVGIPLVYGARFGAAVVPFQIVIWLIPMMWFSGHFRFSLLATGHQRWDFGAAAIAALAVVVAAVLLGPALASRGAAAAMFIGGIVNAVVAVRASNRHIGAISIAASTAPAAAATVVSLGIGLVVTRFAGGAIVGTAAGIAVFALMGLRQRNELAAVRELLPGRGRSA